MTERALEEHLINVLESNGYSYRGDLRDKDSLTANFKARFEELNLVSLSESEFERLLDDIITSDTFRAAQLLRGRNTFVRDDGTPLNYTLVNTINWCKNTFEVVNQVRLNTSNSFHRYDVILLINGVPCVQIELKTLGVSPRRAMEQIVQYKNDVGNGFANSILCYIQLFVVTNRTSTWYFSNNTNKHFSFNDEERFLPVYEYAEEDNTKINHLDIFATTFLNKCTLSETISRYMVLLASERKLMIMRPYQVYAVKNIIDCIDTNCGNGFIWHTTGSGKTLTSFKAATLLKDDQKIDKCIFVVDRKDLDRQTREEFNRFQSGCVEANTSTKALVNKLISDRYADKVIVTTIQKLGLALSPSAAGKTPGAEHELNPLYEQLEDLRSRRLIFIFDECHRSQFGSNHQAIKAFFPRAQFFGFTGTPIFDINSSSQKIEGNQASAVTTYDLFQRQLHSYTISNAIEDGNVLRFRVEYFRPNNSEAIQVDNTITKNAVIDAILLKHSKLTNGRKFNSILATSSIKDAIEYYRLFKQRLSGGAGTDSTINVGCVFSPPPGDSPDLRQLQEDLLNEKNDYQTDPASKKDSLVEIIADYNCAFNTSHSISDFDQYYQDIQKRIKDQQYPNSDLPPSEKLDITIVVDMLLTGFDSKYLNTLYVDKPLRYHGLIQAFSRTNRVLNSTKPYGNIIDFRQQQESVDEAIALFSGETIRQDAKKIWLVEEASIVIDSLDEAVKQLSSFMESQSLSPSPDQVRNLKGDEARITFVNLFKNVQRLRTQLDQYTDLTSESASTIQQILCDDDLLEYRGAYLETASRFRDDSQPNSESSSTLVDQLDFEYVLFASSMIDYDYIMELISRYSFASPGQDTISKLQLRSLIFSDSKFLEDRDDLVEYVDSLEPGHALTVVEVKAGFVEYKSEKVRREIRSIASDIGISPESLCELVEDVTSRLVFDGEKLTDLLAPLDLAWKARKDAELILMRRLIPLLKTKTAGREISGLSAYE